MDRVNNFRLLIIDQNPKIHSDIIKILSVNKKDTTLPMLIIDTTLHHQDGIEKIKDALFEGRPYALAFIGMQVPAGPESVEAIKNIWKIDRDIQIVICTTRSDSAFEITLKKLGISENLLILKKPFDTSTLRQLTTNLTTKWLLNQQSNAYTTMLEQQIQERTNLLQASQSEMHTALESSADGIIIVTTDGLINEYNQNFMKMWEVPDNIMQNKSFASVVQWLSLKLNKQSKLLVDIIDLQDKPEHIRNQTISLTDGQVFTYYTQPCLLNGDIVGRVWSFKDITREAYLESKIEYQATHDALTELPNRALLLNCLKSAIHSANRNKNIVAVLSFDLDRFQIINDNLGLDGGDKVLHDVAQRVGKVVRANDTFARLEGDEFVIVLGDINDKQIVVEIVNRLLAMIAVPFNIQQLSINITASFGISVYPKDAQTPEELIRCADLAMYKAKRDGKNKFQFYEPQLHEQSTKRLELENELRHAIEKQEFVLHYQPQINSLTDKVIGAEALIRWQHPKKGLIPPMEFLPAAEESGLIVQIGKWVLNTACQQNKSWQDAGLPKLPMAVNVSNKQINNNDFLSVVDAAIQSSNLEPKYLEIEVTEETAVNSKKIIDVINALAARGIRIAFDDFGTGSTSLNHLRIVPINRIKIDRSFIKGVTENKSDEVIVRAIISMATELELGVIAEGVETAGQLEFLRHNNCAEIQGFYFSKALTADEMTKLLVKDKLR